MERIPLKLKCVCKSAIWGGTTLSSEWGRENGGEGVAESWELTVREREMSVIEGGAYDGMTLGEWITRAGSDAVSTDWQMGERFPLLVKYIDAADSLSVQVHPDDTYARTCEAETGDTGKTEMWYIVDAAEGATLVYGLKKGIGTEDFMEAVARGETPSALRTVPVRAGESYFIPSGQVHAIGGGILIAEIQQNSDLTYRVYDYDRLSADGTPRQLHLEKAAKVIRPISEEEIDAIRYARGGREDGETLAHCPYFRARRFVGTEEERAETVKDRFHVLLCVAGEGTLTHREISYPLARGDSYFLPAGMGDYTYRGEMTLICAEP